MLSTIDFPTCSNHFTKTFFFLHKEPATVGQRDRHTGHNADLIQEFKSKTRNKAACCCCLLLLLLLLVLRRLASSNNCITAPCCSEVWTTTHTLHSPMYKNPFFWKFLDAPACPLANGQPHGAFSLLLIGQVLCQSSRFPAFDILKRPFGSE